LPIKPPQHWARNIVATRKTLKTTGNKPEAGEENKPLPHWRGYVFMSCVDFKSYRLYEQGAGQQLRVVELITRAAGERMVRRKTALAGVDVDGETLCFQLVEARSSSAVPAFVPQSALGLAGLETPNTAFSQPEMLAIAGTNFKHGRSRTARMNDAQREERARRIYDETFGRVKVGPEDLVESATNKFKAWAQLPVLQDRFRVVDGACL
jgi:hypothetical protein